MANMRRYLDILEGKNPEEVDEGFKDWALSKLGNKKAQGQQQRAAVTKQMIDSWNRWIGQTGNEGTVQDMETFLVKVAGFLPNEVPKILSSVPGIPYRGGQTESTRVWFPVNRIDEAPGIPLTKSQIKSVLDAAAKFIYTDLVGQNNGNNAQAGSNQKSNNSQQQSGNQKSNNNSQNQSSGEQPQGQNKSQSQNNNTQDQGDAFKGTGTLLSNLKRLGLDQDDVLNLAYAVKSGEVGIDSMNGDDASMVKAVGWSYLKSMKLK